MLLENTSVVPIDYNNQKMSSLWRVKICVSLPNEDIANRGHLSARPISADLIEFGLRVIQNIHRLYEGYVCVPCGRGIAGMMVLVARRADRF